MFHLHFQKDISSKFWLFWLES